MRASRDWFWFSFSLVDGAAFKWPSKVITWLQLLRLVIGLKISRQFINQWEGKPKPIATRKRNFPPPLLEQVTWNCYEFGQIFLLLNVCTQKYRKNRALTVKGKLKDTVDARGVFIQGWRESTGQRSTADFKSRSLLSDLDKKILWHPG